MQHSMRDVPLQLSSNIESQRTDSEAYQFVCSSLLLELERLQKDKEENMKLHEAMKLQLKFSFKEEIDQLHKKYDQLLQSAEKKFHENTETIERRYNEVHINKVLAEMMIQDGNAATGTLSLEMGNVTTNPPTDESHQNILQQIRPQNATGPKDILENLPITALNCSMVQMSNQALASARIMSRQDEPSVRSFMTSPQL
ncbi:unnamed protein product [Fraxinus pennsylvanica]|uniref:Uncharacterized protein n=1 Tax=Fraxinus pennsylvanica TaxID=56036 RepID=A0AAD2A6K3_9LAMI|nr:unnamed protein product [Fraxinus pennsylvanica]